MSTTPKIVKPSPEQLAPGQIPAIISKVVSKIQTARLSASNPEDIQRAAEILRNGGLVAFPTETVYGLGANALSPEAVEKIFVAKQRPHWDPLIVHIADRAQLPQIATVPVAAEPLIKAFWPGPLTLLLPRTAAIPDAVTANRLLVGVRIPRHPVALALLQQAGIPIAAPSANTFGHTSPTTADHVLADLDGRIDAILDGGPTEVGLESTVAEVRRDEVIIYRPGVVNECMIESVVGSEVWVHIHEPSPTQSAPESLPSPGVGIRHYAPRARLILLGGLGREGLARSSKSIELSLVDAIDNEAANAVGVMLPDHWNSSCADFVFRWGPWHHPEILAARLYAGLRSLDDQGATVIVCPVPESYGIAEAIRDRLQKAAR
jgi:L-threonylcarbamoyladenylate synthase